MKLPKFVEFILFMKGDVLFVGNCIEDASSPENMEKDLKWQKHQSVFFFVEEADFRDGRYNQ